MPCYLKISVRTYLFFVISYSGLMTVMLMKKLLSCALVASVLLIVSCADDKQRAISLGDKFMKAYLVDADFAELYRYSQGDAERKLRETYEELGPDGVEDMRKNAKEVKVKYVLDEKLSFFSKSCVILVYDVSVGPDYTDKYVMTLELFGSRGRWRVLYF